MQITAYDLAQRFVGVKEFPGDKDNPFVMSMLQLDTNWPAHDEVPWCSAFVNYICWLLRLPRSKNLLARSWLEVGVPISAQYAAPGFDVAVFRRGESGGHVGFFSAAIIPLAQYDEPRIYVLGGNQGNSVSVTSLRTADLLGIRRLV